MVSTAGCRISDRIKIFLSLTFFLALVNYTAFKSLTNERVAINIESTKKDNSINNSATTSFIDAIRMRSGGVRRGNETSASGTGAGFGRFFELAPHLAHLKPPDDDLALRPRVLISHASERIQAASIVIGVPTVKRHKEIYLFKTLDSLIRACNSEELQHVLIVVFIAELVDTDFVTSTIERLQRTYKHEIGNGLIEVLVPPVHFYPDFNVTLRTRPDVVYGDDLERRKWRTKHNYDIAYLMNFARLRAPYYLQLEDDVIARTGFVSDIMKYLGELEANAEANWRWYSISFSKLGFIAKLFRASNLNMFISVFFMFAELKPIDIAWDCFIEAMVCDFGKPREACQTTLSKAKLIYSGASLFQHIGTHSSLKGKIQNIKDKDFKENDVKESSRINVKNPAARRFNSSLEPFENFTLEKAYTLGSVFWGKPAPDSMHEFIRIDFKEPFLLKNYVVWSGSNSHPDDIIPNNSTLEVLETRVDEGRRHRETDDDNDGFYVIAKFGDNTGRVDNLNRPATNDTVVNMTVSSVRISIRGPLKNWILVSDLKFF